MKADKLERQWGVRLTWKQKKWWKDTVWSYRQQDLLNGLIVQGEKKTRVKDDSKAWASKWMVITITWTGERGLGEMETKSAVLDN